MPHDILRCNAKVSVELCKFQGDLNPIDYKVFIVQGIYWNQFVSHNSNKTVYTNKFLKTSSFPNPTGTFRTLGFYLNSIGKSTSLYSNHGLCQSIA